MRAIDYFDKSTDIHSGRVAIEDGDACYTYAETRDFSERIAHAMRANGVEREEREVLHNDVP